MINNDVWVSPNKNWQIEVKNNRLMVSNLITGFNDNPIVYDNGQIGFDSVLPKYIMDAVYRYVNQ